VVSGFTAAVTANQKHQFTAAQRQVDRPDGKTVLAIMEHFSAVFTDVHLFDRLIRRGGEPANPALVQQWLER
jgi:hypothetical protein